ncbi:hypothetical protein ES703_53632 [subsurface metagenome]
MAEANQNPQEAGDAGQGEQPQDVQQPQPSTEVSKDARMWGMLCHLLGLFTCFIGPLIIWLIKKDEDPFIDNQGKEALNFQITVALAGIVSAVLTVVCVGFFLGIAVSIADIVFCILASIKANGGEKYRYPVSIRFIK